MKWTDRKRMENKNKSLGKERSEIINILRKYNQHSKVLHYMLLKIGSLVDNKQKN